MKRITISKSITDFAEDNDFPLSDIATLMKWAINCEKKMSKYGHYFKCELHTITESYISLPDSVVDVHKIFFGDVTDEFERVFSNSNTIRMTEETVSGIEYAWSSLNGVQLNELLWEWANGNINFTTNYDGEEVTVFFTELEKNDEGFIIVNESHIEAIQAYLKFKIAEREEFKRNMGRAADGNFMRYTRELKLEYARKLRDAAAQDTRESNIDENAI